MTPEELEVTQLRSRVRELEASQRQLEIYAEDLRRTFAELRRQLGHMNELHRLSAAIGSILDPREVMDRTLEGLGHLVPSQAACIYLVDGDAVIRAATRGDETLLPSERSPRADPVLGPVLEGAEPGSAPEQARSLTVAMRAGGMIVGALHIARSHGAPLTGNDRKLADLVAAEAANAVYTARLYEQTQRLATTDSLTGLYNHRYFRDALALEIARANRLGYSVGLLMIDVDNFKRVNDTFGHPVGDDVLRNIADVLRTSLRQTDVAARYGGEEFAVVLPGLGPRGVLAVGEKLRRAVRRLQPLLAESATPCPISVSVGGVSASPPNLNMIDLVRVADTALYEAKRRGRDCVWVEPTELLDEAPAAESERHEQAHRPAS